MHPLERRILKALVEKLEKGVEELSMLELADAAGMEADQARRAIEWLREKGLVRVRRVKTRHYRLGPNGLRSLRQGLPEEIILGLLKQEKGQLSIKDLTKRSGLDAQEFNAAIGRLVRSGNVKLESGNVKLVNPNYGENIVRLLRKISEKGSIVEDELSEEEKKLIREELARRPGYLEILEEKDSIISLNIPLEAAAKYAAEPEEVTVLTPEMLASGAWKRLKLAKLNVKAPTPSVYPGRAHPITVFKKLIRDAFLSMGFEEIEGNLIQPTFWNFDVLYTPQDHPARDLQDTFYVDERAEKLDEELVKRVRATHEYGWKTGSRGWGYAWREEDAKKLVLRTHTTVLTVKALYLLKEKPLLKVFSIGRVFRNEKVDAKHLVEFHQIEGIVKEKNANLRKLMGYITEFYSKLGFKKIKFWPTYFPYTEPSLQVMVYEEKRGEWLELGGMGIFRPEVTLPLGVKEPVLAWGLGLERIIMLRLGVEDARILYSNDLSWLRRVGECQLLKFT